MGGKQHGCVTYNTTVLLPDEPSYKWHNYVANCVVYDFWFFKILKPRLIVPILTCTYKWRFSFSIFLVAHNGLQ